MNPVIRPTKLVLEGGGTLGIAYVGALSVLHKKGILKNIKHFAGTSVGAILASALALGADYKFVKDIIYNLDFNVFLDSSYGIIRDLWRLFTTYGFYKGDAVVEWLEICYKKTGHSPNITFKEAHDTLGTTLTVVGTNLSQQKPEYYNFINTPDMPIKDAVRISMSIPYFFKPIIRNNDILVDGGVLNNYPSNIFSTFENENDSFYHFIGIRVDKQMEIEHKYSPIRNIVDFSKSFIDTWMNQNSKMYVSKNDWIRSIVINIDNKSSTDFNISNEDKDFLYTRGKQSAEQFIDSIPKYIPTISKNAIEEHNKDIYDLSDYMRIK